MRELSFTPDSIDIKTIQFIIFTPFDEFYYSYAINNLDSQHLIDKNEITFFMEKIDKKVLAKISFLSKRFLPFMYVVANEELLELEESLDEEALSLLLKPRFDLDEVEENSKISLYDKVKKGFMSIF